MMYEDDAMILVEVNTPTWRRMNFNNNLNKEGLSNLVDLVDEIRTMSQVREFATKQRTDGRFNTRVRPKRFQEGDLVLKSVTDTKKKGKPAPN